MKILVSNIGSTSFKFRLFEMTTGSSGNEAELATGGADRIGGKGGVLKLRAGGKELSQSKDFADHGQAIGFVLESLIAAGVLASPRDLDAVAFKAVMAGDIEPVVLVDDKVLAQMEFFVPVAPAHNPPYIAAMRMFRKALGETPLVAAFETGFHKTNPERRRLYAVPPEWAEKYGVKRYGFHGASHRYIATRTAQLMPQAKRIISCHLGGSSSLCAILNGQSQAVSMGLSPQSGLPQSNRAGDFDPFAFLLLRERAGMDADAVLSALGKNGGLMALSGTSGDIRDVRQAAAAEAAAGTPGKGTLTLELFATAVRDYLGAYLVELGGADAIVFTGGIGEHNPDVRKMIARGLEFAGIVLDDAKNDRTQTEGRIDAANSRTALWVMPTNEELIVARQAAELLKNRT